MNYMTSATVGGRVLRHTSIMLVGVILSYLLSKTPVGSSTSGAILIHAELIGLYTQTSVQAKGYLKKRIILQLMAVFSAVIVNTLLYMCPITQPFRWLRIFLAIGVCTPVLMTINLKKNMGLSEIGMMVPVALISLLYDSTPTYFITRLVYTTCGVMLSFVFFTRIAPVRHDLRYDSEVRKIRVQVLELLNKERKQASSEHIIKIRQAQSRIQKDLDILKVEAFATKRMARWKPVVPVLIWETECNEQLFHVLELSEEFHNDSESDMYAEIVGGCFAVHKEILELLQSSHYDSTILKPQELPKHFLGTATTVQELKLLNAIVTYHETLRAYPISEGL